MNCFIIWLSTLNSTVKLLPVYLHPFDCLALVQVNRKALLKQQQPNEVEGFVYVCHSSMSKMTSPHCLCIIPLLPFFICLSVAHFQNSYL